MKTIISAGYIPAGTKLIIPKKEFMPCPEEPDKVTGNVTCDTWGYCPYGEVCNQEVRNVRINQLQDQEGTERSSQ